MKKIAVIYASEGTGHRAAAGALRDRFLLDNPGGEVFFADVLDYLPAFLRRLVADGYLLMVRRAPWAWGWFYKSSDKTSFLSRVFESAHSLFCRRCLPRLERDLLEFAPDAVFFTHYFGAAPLAARNTARYPVFCVDTDFLTHRYQRGRTFAASFAASFEAVRQRADEGIKNVYCTGVPIAPGFLEAVSKEGAREKLGLEKERVTVLLSGGGVGAGSLERALVSLAAKSEWQILIICGNNKKLHSKLSRRYATVSHVRVEAFVANMRDYYAASDIAVMKPGGLSLSEALACGLPLLLMDPIPGQEELNLGFILRRGAAVELTGVDRAASVVKNILDDPEKIRAMKKAAAELAQPAAASGILSIAGKIAAERGLP